MKKKSISQEEILKACLEMTKDKGINQINMRDLASHCHIALGSLYNYYPSKNDLLVAVIASIWKDIIMNFEQTQDEHNFIHYITDLFHAIAYGKEEYPQFFAMHAIQFSNQSKAKDKHEMDLYLKSIKQGMYEAYMNDPHIRKDIFLDDISISQFIDFIFENMISVLSRGLGNIDVLIYMIKHLIYECS